MAYRLYTWFTRHVLSCQEATRLISESCERPLTWWERLRVWVLKRLCPYTCRYAVQVRQLHRQAILAGHIDVEVSSLGLSGACKERLRREIALLEAEESGV